MNSLEWQSHPATQEYLRRVSTATVTTQLLKRGFRTRFMHEVRPLRLGQRMLGPARTLRYVPMREDLATLSSIGTRANVQRQLIEDTRAGEVVVIDGLGLTGAASLGSILALRLQVRGVAGIVTDGAYRDTPGIRELEIPAYARSQNANSNVTLYHPADADTVIGCGGVFVEPGDGILGDDEGVVVIPRDHVTAVAHDAIEQEVAERYIYERVRAGAGVFDVYPLNEQEAARFAQWRERIDPLAFLDGEPT